MIHLDFRDARPIYSQITDTYRSQILSGVLVEGDRLPSVRELAAQLSINPNTIQRAYRELEAQGWIATVPGKGCFVCAVPAQTSQPQAGQMDAFRQAVRELLSQGVSPDTLIDEILKGGNRHA